MTGKLANFFKKEPVIMFLILALAFALRLVNLGVEPFWGDEALSFDIVKRYQGDIAGLVDYLREIEVHPPLYYILLEYWSRIFGLTEVAAKALSVLFGTALVGLVYHAGRRLFPGTKYGLWAAFIVAILPMQIEYSQEARPYVIFVFFGVWHILSLWQYLRMRGYRYLTQAVVSAVVGMYLHYSFGFILAGTFSWWLLEIAKSKSSRDFTIWLSSVFSIFAGFYYWLQPFLYKFVLAQVELHGLERTPSPVRASSFLETTLNQLVWLTQDKRISPWEIASSGLFKIVLVALSAAFIIRKAETIKSGLKNSVISFFLWIASSALLVFLFSPQSQPYTVVPERHLIIISVLFAFILARLLIGLKTKERYLLVAIFIVSILNFNIRVMGDSSVWDPQYRIKTIADHINENYEPGDMVATYFGFGRTDLNHYLRPEISVVALYPIYPLAWQDDHLASRETLGLAENEAQLRIIKPSDPQVDMKIGYLLDRYEPRRIWVYGNERLFKDRLLKDGWRHAFKSLGDLFPLDLYVKE